MTDSSTLLARVLVLPSVPYADRTRRLPNQPGLYFAVQDGAEVLYIGMSRKSIRQRWKTYHSAVEHVKKFSLEDRVRIAYVLYRDTDRLKHDERAALLEFRPLLNSMGVPGALERDQRKSAEECQWIDCEEHWHSKWPQREPPTKSRQCVCIVHRSCAERDGAEFRAALKMDAP